MQHRKYSLLALLFLVAVLGHDEHANALPDLRRGQPHAFGLVHRLEHVLGEFGNTGKIGHGSGFGAQHRVAIESDRQDHWGILTDRGDGQWKVKGKK